MTFNYLKDLTTVNWRSRWIGIVSVALLGVLLAWCSDHTQPQETSRNTSKEVTIDGEKYLKLGNNNITIYRYSDFEVHKNNSSPETWNLLVYEWKNLVVKWHYLFDVNSETCFHTTEHPNENFCFVNWGNILGWKSPEYKILFWQKPTKKQD